MPVALLLPRLFHETDAGGRRRRAFWYTVLFIFIGGIILDFMRQRRTNTDLFGEMFS